MLANNVVLSRFRYWAQRIYLPKEITNAIACDVHAQILHKESCIEQDEIGIESRNQTWVSKEARNIPVSEGGMSLLNNEPESVGEHKCLTYALA